MENKRLFIDEREIEAKQNLERAFHPTEKVGTTFFIGDKDGEMIDYEPELVTGFLGEFDSFHKAIREGLPSPVPAEEALITAKIFDAIYESARIGRSVPILASADI